jgi:hypothetical protein
MNEQHQRKELKDYSFGLLGHGFLSPDRENLLFYLKCGALIAVIWFTGLLAGLAINQC